MKTKQHYLDRATYLRRLAKDAVTDKLRETCLKSAEQFEELAKHAGKSAEDDGGNG